MLLQLKPLIGKFGIVIKATATEIIPPQPGVALMMAAMNYHNES